MRHITLNTKNSGLEKIMKYCSTLNQKVGYPYFFNWSTCTNHWDNSSKGQLEDVDYVTIRVGKYIRGKPKESSILFGLINSIVDTHFAFRELIKNREYKFNLNSDKDIELIRKSITKFLSNKRNYFI